MSATVRKGAMEDVFSYWREIPMQIQEDIPWGEEDVKVESEFMYKDEVRCIMGKWVPDTGSSISKDAKYLKTATFYCHLKGLMGKSMLEKQVANTKILTQLDGIQTDSTRWHSN